MGLNRDGRFNFRNEFFLVLIIFLITTVSAFEANSTSYVANNKFDFGLSVNASSSSFTSSVISGFEAVSNYTSSSFLGRFGFFDGGDTVPPQITIVSPSEQTYFSSNIYFEVSSDEILSSCKLSVNDWKTNYTMQVNSYVANYTLSLGDGNFTARFSCSDFSGNVNNSESVLFGVSVPLNITILSPENETTYLDNFVDLNWSVNKDLSSCSYSLDGGANNSSICFANPELKSYFSNESLDFPYAVKLDSGYAYVLGYFSNSLSVIDVSDSKNPLLIAVYKNDTSLYGANGIDIEGNYAYVASRLGDSLTVIDISSRANPVQVGFLNDSSTLSVGNAKGVDVVGDYAYVIGQYGSSLVVVNVTDKSSPLKVSHFQNGSSLNSPEAVYVSGDYAYVASYTSNSLTIINISNKGSLRQINSFSNTSLSGAYDLDISGDYAYVASSINDSLTIINISDKNNLKQVGYFSNTSLDTTRSIKVRDNYAYLASAGSRSLTVINVSSVSNLEQVGFFTNSTVLAVGDSGSLDIEGNYTYIVGLTSDSMIILDRYAVIPRNVTLDSLSDGEHNVSIYAEDKFGNSKRSDYVYFNINPVPIVSNVSISSDDLSNQSDKDLICFAVLNDSNSNPLNVTVIWYNNSVQSVVSNYYNHASNVDFTDTLYYKNTTRGENWSCSVNTFDGSWNSGYVSSGELTILNTPPVVTLVYPENNAMVTNVTPNFNWTGYDEDGDSLTYDFNLSLVAASLCTDLDNFVEDISGENYTSELSCYYDNGDYYVWRVRGKDVFSTGEWSGGFNISLAALVDISLPVDAINFGTINFGGTNDTTDDSPLPLVVQNNGNSFVNLNISADDLWDSEPNPSQYYQMKVDNVTSEEGAFNWSGSTTSWTYAPATGYTIFLSKLNYSDEADSAEVDVSVQVPPTEIPTAKTSTITFVASFAD